MIKLESSDKVHDDINDSIGIDMKIPKLKPSSLRFGKSRGSGTFSDIIDIDWGPLSDDDEDDDNFYNNDFDNSNIRPTLLTAPLKRINTMREETCYN